MLRNLAIGFICGLALLVAQAASAQPRCGGDSPERFAAGFFGRLESARNSADFKNIYERELSSKLRSQLSVARFAQESTQIKRDLGIEGRSFEQRITRPPMVESRAGPSGATNVIAQTSSPRGKVEQRLVLECEQGQWKANGFWYEPARY